MFLAVWCPDHGDATYRLALALAERCTVFECGDGFLAARPPFVVERLEGRVWARPRSLPTPIVELSATSLRLEAGALPQLPAYFHWDRRLSRAIACSELNVLRRLVSPKLNRRRLVSLAAGIADPWPGETVFSDLRRLAAGGEVVFDARGMQTSKKLPACGNEFEQAPVAQLADQLRREISAATRRALDGTKQAVVLAGGGLDSSGLLAIAMRESAAARMTVRALAEVWTAPGDDRPYLEALERHLGVHAERKTAGDAAPFFRVSLSADAQPQLWSGAAHTMMLWAAAGRMGAGVTLGGYGGDIVFGGRPSFAPLVVRGHLLEALRQALALRVPWPMSPRARIRSWVVTPTLRPFVPRRLYARARLRRVRQPWMRGPFVADLEEALAVTDTERTPRTPNEWMAHFAEHRVFSELSASWGAIASVVRTSPVDVFRDVELVRFVARINPVVRNDGANHRGLFRRAIDGLVPEVVRLRSDKATIEPAVAAAAVAADEVSHLTSLGSLVALADLGLVEPAKFRRDFDIWMAAIRRGERAERDPADECWQTVWQLLSVEEFLREWGGAG